MARRPPPRLGLAHVRLGGEEATDPDVDVDLDRLMARGPARVPARVAGAHDDPRGQQLDLFAVEFFDGECVHVLLLCFLNWFVGCLRGSAVRPPPGRSEGARCQVDPVAAVERARLRARGCSDRRLVTSAAWWPSSTVQVRMGACRQAEGTTVAHRAAVTRYRQTTELG